MSAVLNNPSTSSLSGRSHNAGTSQTNLGNLYKALTTSLGRGNLSVALSVPYTPTTLGTPSSSGLTQLGMPPQSGWNALQNAVNLLPSHSRPEALSSSQPVPYT